MSTRMAGESLPTVSRGAVVQVVEKRCGFDIGDNDISAEPIRSTVPADAALVAKLVLPLGHAGNVELVA